MDAEVGIVVSQCQEDFANVCLHGFVVWRVEPDGSSFSFLCACLVTTFFACWYAGAALSNVCLLHEILLSLAFMDLRICLMMFFGVHMNIPWCVIWFPVRGMRVLWSSVTSKKSVLSVSTVMHRPCSPKSLWRSLLILISYLFGILLCTATPSSLLSLNKSGQIPLTSMISKSPTSSHTSAPSEAPTVTSNWPDFSPTGFVWLWLKRKD